MSVKKYSLARFILLILGIVAYLSHNFWIINIPVVSFVFGNISFYLISPIIPALIALGYAVSYKMQSTNLLILLTVFDAFSFPYGTAFAIALIFYLIYKYKPSFTKRQAVAILLPFVVALPVAYYFFTPTSPSYSSPSVMALSEQEGTQEYILKLKDFPAPQAVEVQSVVVQDVETLGGNVVDTVVTPVNSMLITLDSSKIAELMKNKNIEAIYPNEKVVRVFNDTFLLDNVRQFLHISSIPANGSGIVVAVVDTGINEKIPQLQRNGKSVVVDKYELYGDYVYPHGTEVACCIGSQDPDYPGVAPGVDLLDVEVFQSGGLATYWDIIRGWNWVAQWKISHNRYVICSNSFGSPPDAVGCSILRTAVDNMVLKYGIPMIVASGNSFSDRRLMCPGDAEYAFTVGAVDKTNMLAQFSCYGNGLDVVNYGVNIHSFDTSGNRVTVSGTSFSTPITAGAFALVAEKEKLPALQMYNLFRKTAKDLGAPGYDTQYGYGLVNPVDAYSVATNQRVFTTNTESIVTVSLIPSMLGLVYVSYPRRRYGI